ncbi:MAG: hypothetical protein ACK4E3_09070 [Brevundimonas sp.]|uniref:hypothetical protein n=1 Tax=Brevundimonas sp. TaxID=1871086 RepID=UPI0039199FE9
MYPLEFPVENAAPVLDPTLLALAGLLVLALVVVAFCSGSWWRGRELGHSRAHVCEDIYDAIARAADKAAGARRPEVIARCGDLVQVLERTLGPVIRLGGDLAHFHGRLKAGLHPEAAYEPPPRPRIDSHAPASTGVTNTIGAHAVVHQTFISGEPRDEAGHGERGHGEKGRGDSDDRGKDSVDIATARAAALAFRDYWSERAARLDDLRAAQKALLTHPPRKA